MIGPLSTSWIPLTLRCREWPVVPGLLARRRVTAVDSSRLARPDRVMERWRAAVLVSRSWAGGLRAGSPCAPRGQGLTGDPPSRTVGGKGLGGEGGGVMVRGGVAVAVVRRREVSSWEQTSAVFRF